MANQNTVRIFAKLLLAKCNLSLSCGGMHINIKTNKMVEQLILHSVGDYLIQNHWMAKNKRFQQTYANKYYKHVYARDRALC